jgi:hypothetical protein
VLIDNGARLNIVFSTLLIQLDYFEESINLHHKITIKVYDEVERKYLGLVVLPLWVGPVKRDVTYHVLNIPLAYNIFLGRPWIHEMQVVPSTYHEFVKFPFHGSKVTILASTSYTCNMLKHTKNFVPTNTESIDYHDNELKKIE